MKKVHIVSVLDRSGSMSGVVDRVRGAYDEFINAQKVLLKEKGIKGKSSLYIFDDVVDTVYQGTDLDKVEPLSSDIYYARGLTALYDAVGKAITDFEGKKNVVVFIDTDGFENASREFKGDELKDLIEKKQKDGWEFLFSGADLTEADVVGIASTMGIPKGQTFQYDKTENGYKSRTLAMNSTMASYVA